MLPAAPTFAEVASDVARYLSGTVVVAHNLAFEDKFLAAEFRRAQYPAASWPGLCTMVNARAQLEGQSYSLASVYRTLVGEWLEDHHLAISDARAAASVLSRMIRDAPSPLRYYGPQPVASDRRLPATRIAARSGTGGPVDGLVAAMASRLPRTDGTHPADQLKADEYLKMLAGLLGSGRIKRVDAAALERAARDAGLDQAGVQRVNARAWDQICKAAGDPATPGQRQLQGLAAATSSLGLVDQAQRFQQHAAIPASPAGLLKGWRIGLIPGTAEADEAVRFATAHGAVLAKRLTKTVRIVVADDPKGQNGQLDVARQLGLRVLSPAQASHELHTAVEVARAKERAELSRQAQQNHERDVRRRAAEAHWSHRWRPREADPSWGWVEDGVTVKLK